MEEGIINFDQADSDQVGQKKSFNWEEWLFAHKWTVIFLLIGTLLLGVGILSTKSLNLFNDDTKVEVLGDNTEVGGGKGEVSREVRGEIIVEIAGEVQKPGVYHLNEGERISDLLVLAGGLSANADREYVSKNINQAQKLADGVKVYIPNKIQITNDKSQINTNEKILNVQNKVNINTATVSDLDRLWGIGEVTAKKIIDNRPYQKPEELLSRKIIKENVWEAIRDKVTVW